MTDKFKGAASTFLWCVAFALFCAALNAAWNHRGEVVSICAWFAFLASVAGAKLWGTSHD